MKNIVFNTGESNDQLRKEYNPEGSHLRNVQLRMLDMLLYLDKICKKINVSYRLEGGTFLGAIRHQGFIPWDDDVDVAIDDISEWKRLKAYLKDHPHNQFVLQDEESDSGFINYWMTIRDLKSEYVHEIKQLIEKEKYRKYRGLQIDIFPFSAGILPFIYKIDKKITNIIGKRLFIKCRRIAIGLHRIQKNIFHPIFYKLSSWFGNKDIYMHAYGASWMPRFKKDVLFPYRDYQFEGYWFPGPNNADEYLKEKYGDYMNLPPINERRHHKVSIKLW